MSATTSWTTADLEAIETAAKKGVRSVTYPNGTTVTFSSLSEMLQLRAVVRDAINNKTEQRSMSTLARVSKG